MTSTKEAVQIRGLKVGLILPVLFIVIAFLLRFCYGLPLIDSFLLYAGVIFSFYIPGNLLLRHLDHDDEEYFVRFFLSVALGVALMPLLYMLLRRLAHPEFLFVIVFVLSLLWSILFMKDIKKIRGKVYTSYLDILSIFVLTAIVLVILHLSYFTDVVFLESGFKVRDVFYAETFFPLGIINALKDIYPVYYPYASGVDLSFYHINMHLQIEMINRLFSVDTLKLSFYYFPLIYFMLLVFLPFMIVNKYTGSRSLGVLTGILMFGSDLSFIPGLLGMLQEGFTWNVLFNSTTWPLFTLNGYLPVLSVMFLCILYLKKFCESGLFSHAIVFGFLGFSAYGFKSSMGPHIMAVAFVTGLILILTDNRKKGILLCTVSSLTLMAIGVDVLAIKGTLGVLKNAKVQYTLSPDIFNRLHDSLNYLAIPKMPWYLYLLVFPIYIIAVFGARIIGFGFLRDFFVKKEYDHTVIFLMIFVASGFLLSELIFLGPILPSPFKTNDAMWFSFQSLLAAWLLFAFYLKRTLPNIKKVAFIMLLVILLSFPGTVQFLLHRSVPRYFTVTSDAIEVAKYLKTTPPESVISEFESCIVQNIGVQETLNRLNDVAVFFNSDDKSEDKREILDRYKVSYVYAPSAYAELLDEEPSLLQVFRNSEYIVYKVKDRIRLQGS